MIMQILSGACLSFLFFNSFVITNWLFVIYIYDFIFGFVIRSCHIVNTSFVFFLIYIHILKTIFLLILFDTHNLVWFVGFLIYVLVVVIAFIGYVLPCTMMSYWGLTVFSNILATIPLFGSSICFWIWGSEFINDFTLIKLHALHIFLPFLLLFLIFFHLFCLHYFISSDAFFDRFAFYFEKTLFCFWFFYRDCFLTCNMFFVLTYFLCINWYFVFHEESFEIVDTLKTSDKILPEWFFLYLFGFLKAIPSKLIGFCVIIVILVGVFFCFLQCFLLFYNIKFFFFVFNICILFLILIVYCSFLATYVILCFPIWTELQFIVIFLLFVMFFKLD